MTQPTSDWNLVQSQELKRADRILWYNIPKSPLALELLRAEEELTDLVDDAKQEIQGVPYSADVRKFWTDTLAKARPALQRRQQLAQSFNQQSKLYSYLNEDTLRVIFDYATCCVQDSYHFPGKRNLKDSLQIASVTRMWRSLAIDTGFLWSSLTFSPKSDCDIFRSFLERSQGSDLFISIEIGDAWQYNPSQLISMLKPISTRVKAIHITAPHMLFSAHYADLLMQPFPKATIVDIDSHGFPPLAVPSLAYLRLNINCISPYSSKYGTLTFLELTGANVNELIHIIRSAFRLRSLKVATTYDSEIDENYLSHCFVHSALENLEANHEGIIQVFTLPHLQSLCLWCRSAALPQFLQRSGCALTQFGVQDVTDASYVIDIPTITNIVVKVDTMQQCGAIFRYLNEYLKPEGRIRNISIRVDDAKAHAKFLDGNPYLLSSLFLYYVTNSAHIERIAIETDAPFELTHLWNTLFRSFPAVVSVNNFPIAHFRRPAVPDVYIVDVSHSRLGDNGRDYLTMIHIREMDFAEWK